ncbi:MAG: hypothetical protein CL676_11900 [Bdellovibrionaceae bacterium]|nr:hypothetical protein [Pseudobdellovibrionaceae bacterium]|tara:strand:- start:2616 stop:3377 length:762 start_codon:yes stop_codon:yes gene_type:complete
MLKKFLTLGLSLCMTPLSFAEETPSSVNYASIAYGFRSCGPEKIEVVKCLHDEKDIFSCTALENSCWKTEEFKSQLQMEVNAHVKHQQRTLATRMAIDMVGGTVLLYGAIKYGPKMIRASHETLRGLLESMEKSKSLPYGVPKPGTVSYVLTEGTLAASRVAIGGTYLLTASMGIGGTALLYHAATQGKQIYDVTQMKNIDLDQQVNLIQDRISGEKVYLVLSPDESVENLTEKDLDQQLATMLYRMWTTRTF